MKHYKYFILIVCLFFPIRFFEIFHLLLIFVLLVYIILNKKFIVNDGARVFIALILFLWFGNLIRSLFLNNFSIRDYIEVIRFIPLILLLVSGIHFRIREIMVMFLVYLSLDMFVSIAQFFQLGVGNFFANIYGSENHRNISLGISSRALGFSSGPGQHGSIISLMYIFFLYLFIYQKENKWKSFLGIFFALVSILLSQSQTSFIAVGVVSVFIVFYTFITGNVNEKKTGFAVFAFLFIGGATIFYTFLDELRYLYALVELGLGRNSYQIRVGRTGFIWSLASSYPILMFIGYGKDFFGTLSGAMDNEYLYVFFIYGFIIGFIFLLAAGIFIIKVLLFSSKFPKHYLLITFTILVGLIIALPTAFFTDPRILILFSSLILIRDPDQIEKTPQWEK